MAFLSYESRVVIKELKDLWKQAKIAWLLQQMCFNRMFHFIKFVEGLVLVL